MQKVGIVGGTSPESTVYYYQTIISTFQTRMGSTEVLPELLINSINMHKMLHLLMNKQTEQLIDYLTHAIEHLEKAGCDFVVMAANTPHIVFEQVSNNVQIPMISIVEETYKETVRLGIENIGLLGTQFTMANDFFKKPFISSQKNIIVPNPSEQEYIHKKIVEELGNGIITNETKHQLIEILNRMITEEHIQGVILGCTELPMLIKPKDTVIHQLNTTDIHINKIVDRMFEDK